MDNNWLTDSRTQVIGKGECVECGREFDLLNDQDADEWCNGHDCEPDYEPSTCATR